MSWLSFGAKHMRKRSSKASYVEIAIFVDFQTPESVCRRSKMTCKVGFQCFQTPGLSYGRPKLLDGVSDAQK